MPWSSYFDFVFMELPQIWNDQWFFIFFYFLFFLLDDLLRIFILIDKFLFFPILHSWTPRSTPVINVIFLLRGTMSYRVSKRYHTVCLFLETIYILSYRVTTQIYFYLLLSFNCVNVINDFNLVFYLYLVGFN